ncbi:formate dehydrogenase accessory protein FdhE [Variovorax sp. LT1R16]|uniref:formate dehydrogenase accessory protein FdhE n=1 Tax=Variovorax sp. LT1R16 TaxID=3443728 RepID=UPI003F453EAC
MTSPDSSSTPVRTTRVLSPEEIAMQAGRQMPFVRLPVRAAVFSDRQLRLRQLAASHPMREYLLFVADLAAAQHQALQDHPPVAVPDASACDAAAKALKPPMPAFGWPRDPLWQATLRRVLALFVAPLAAGPVRDTVERLLASPADWIDAQADRLSRRITLGLDLATAPLIAAGLQTYWAHLALQTADTYGERVFGHTEPGTECPCCGSLPTASITRIGAEDGGFRYLHCSLCSTQWHYVRIKCTHCESTKGIQFQQLTPEPGVALPATGARPGAAKAECCDACHHYLKQVAMEKDPEVEPVADDLASITLDLLVADAGYERSGHNLMLLFGES